MTITSEPIPSSNLLLMRERTSSGVASEGNAFFEPNGGGTAEGGVSEGHYDLRIDFKSSVNTSASLTAAVSDSETDFAVDDASGFEVDDFARIGNEVVQITGIAANVLTVTRGEFDTDPQNHLNVATLSKLGILTDGSGSALDGDRDGVAGGNYNFWFQADTGDSDPLTAGQKTLHVIPTAQSLNSSDSSIPADEGSLERPFWNIPAALQHAEDLIDADNGIDHVIVRLLPDAGSDDDLATLSDNTAYEIGFVQSLNRPLADGRNLTLPGGVSLMVEAGVVMKFLDSRISVGSDDDGADRSGSSIQVLGTPDFPVHFTSYNDRDIGVNQNPDNSRLARPGDWGGIEIRNDVDRELGRSVAEVEGIFQNYVNHAVISFGGGDVSGINRAVNPLHLSEARAEISYNTILDSADAAISADPNSFRISTFAEPRFQRSSLDGSDGFVADYERIGPDIHGNTLLGNSTNGLFIRIETPAGGSLEELEVAARFNDTDIVHVLGESLLLNGAGGGAFQESRVPAPIIGVGIDSSAGNLAAGNYSYRYTFVDPFGYESIPSAAQNIAVADGEAVSLQNIPAASGVFVARRLYRLTPGETEFKLIAELDKSSSDYIDTVATSAETAAILLTQSRRPRPDASLIVDPGTIVKSQGARIELQTGATLIAEGTQQHKVIFTSRADDRFGAGGTFDTNDDGESIGEARDWAGIYASMHSRLSVDQARIAFGGGVTGVEGGTAAFNVIQIHQADARIANTLFEDNGGGTGGLQVPGGPQTRTAFGYAPNSDATIYVTAAQPTIVNNTFLNNVGSAININVASMDADFRTDPGRQTSGPSFVTVPPANVGPVIRGNELDNNGINGMIIRGEVLTSEVVLDDTDIVHVILNDIEIPDFHHFGGMRLQSSSTESLVVKLGNNAQILATGRPLDITDRIGGRLLVLGQPGFPVVMTSTQDTTAGAGFTPEGIFQTDTFNGSDSPSPGDWRGLTFDPYSHDRNVVAVTESEGDIGGFGDANSTIGNQQELGSLAANEKSGDENLKLGYTIHGSISSNEDQDIYSFQGVAGTMVWLDIDRTDPQLDTVLEILDGDGDVLALSQDSRTEQAANPPALTYVNTAKIRDGHALPMRLDIDAATNVDGSYRDLYSMNDGNSGMRIVLPGTEGVTARFYVRVRSSNATVPADINNPAPGDNKGGYQLQIRLRETDEVAGSVVRYADLRYAQTAIEAIGLPAHSPLAGEIFHPGTGTIDIGSFANTDRGAVSAAGNIDNTPDTYQFQVNRDSLQRPVPDASQSLVFDIDWADGLTRPDTTLYVFDTNNNLIALGTNSNILDDQITPIVPGQPTTQDDLSRGSQSKRDAFIGPLELPFTNSANQHYSVSVSTTEQMVADMQQFTLINAPNKGFRLEPLDSTVRVVDDRFDIDAPGVGDAQLPAEIQDVTFSQESITPWHFGDIPLLAINRSGNGFGNNSQINIYNPYTGRHDAIIDENTSPVGAAAQSPNGTVLAIERPIGDPTDENTHTVYSISADGQLTNVGDTGILTYTYRNIGGNSPHANRRASEEFTDGMIFKSLAYYNDNDSTNRFLYGVADRPDFEGSDIVGDANNNDVIGATTTTRDGSNLIYRLDPETGAVQSRNGVSMPSGFQSADPLDSRLRDGRGANVPVPPETPWAGTNAIAQIQIPTTNAGGMDTGDVTSLVTDVRDGQRFLYAFTDEGAVWEMAITESNTGLYNPGDIIGFPTLIFDPNGGNAGTDFIADSDGNVLIFDQVTEGPKYHNELVNGGVDVSNIYFGVEAGTGDLYAFDLHDNPARAQLAFQYSQESATLDTTEAGGGGLAGIFFSNLDRTLWHLSDSAPSEGHGMPGLSDRPRVGGGGSLRFGFDSVNADWNHLSNNDFGTYQANELTGFSGYNFLGGAHGSVQGDSIDLSGISAADLPMLYFTYILDSERTNANADADGDGSTLSNGGLDAVMRDSLRVYVAGVDNDWALVATNNMADSIDDRVWNDSRLQDSGADRLHEYDPVVSGYTNVGQQRFVQELFDDNVFRQARIDLGPWAGQDDVKIRFEFSTAGETRPDQTELQLVSGNRVVDGQFFKLEGLLPEIGQPALQNREVDFEYDLGLVIQMPAGAQVVDSASAAIVDPLGTTVVDLKNLDVSIAPISAADNATDVAAKVLEHMEIVAPDTAVIDVLRPSVVSFTQTSLDNYAVNGIEITGSSNQRQRPTPTSLVTSIV